MSRHDYLVSKQIVAESNPFYAVIMAAMRQADTHNSALLQDSFPGIWKELQARYNAPGGYLDTDDQPGQYKVTVGIEVDQYDGPFPGHQGDNAPSITCPQCGMTSYNGQDITNQYCGHCHAYHHDMKERT